MALLTNKIDDYDDNIEDYGKGVGNILSGESIGCPGPVTWYVMDPSISRCSGSRILYQISQLWQGVDFVLSKT